jgi:hypothetical protein
LYATAVGRDWITQGGMNALMAAATNCPMPHTHT